jgi:hypothetical protein
MKHKYEYMGHYILMPTVDVPVLNWKIFMKFSKKIIPVWMLVLFNLLSIIQIWQQCQVLNGKDTAALVDNFESLCGIM